MNFNRRITGSIYEEKAAKYLKEQGYVILEMNYRFHRAEIDIVAKDKNYLVFIEVKFRNSMKRQHPLDAVDYHKQMQIIYAAKGYMYSHRLPADTPCRFDVVACLGDQITLIRNAFGGW